MRRAVNSAHLKNKHIMFVTWQPATNTPCLSLQYLSVENSTKRVARSGDYKLPVFVGGAFDLMLD